MCARVRLHEGTPCTKAVHTLALVLAHACAMQARCVCYALARAGAPAHVLACVLAPCLCDVRTYTHMLAHMRAFPCPSETQSVGRDAVRHVGGR